MSLVRDKGLQPLADLALVSLNDESVLQAYEHSTRGYHGLRS
jgi:hypothetical protein